MTLSSAHRTLIASALVAGLGLLAGPSFGQGTNGSGNSNGPGTAGAGMQQPPGSEGTAGATGTTTPPGTAASPSGDKASGSGTMHTKHKYK